MKTMTLSSIVASSVYLIGMRGTSDGHRQKKEWRHVAMLLQTKQLMDRLQARIGAGTRSDTIRRALALLELVTADQDKGGEVSIRGQDGTQTRLRLL
jgi:hypothetical protein